LIPAIPVQFIHGMDQEDPPSQGGTPGLLGNQRQFEVVPDGLFLTVSIKDPRAGMVDARRLEKGGLLYLVLGIDIIVVSRKGRLSQGVE
jgi:hypothetical protein